MAFVILRQEEMPLPSHTFTKGKLVTRGNQRKPSWLLRIEDKTHKRDCRGVLKWETNSQNDLAGIFTPIDMGKFVFYSWRQQVHKVLHSQFNNLASPKVFHWNFKEPRWLYMLLSGLSPSIVHSVQGPTRHQKAFWAKAWFFRSLWISLWLCLPSRTAAN